MWTSSIEMHEIAYVHMSEDNKVDQTALRA